MNVGDKVVTIGSVGTIVGVSTNGFPIVEWPGESDFSDYPPEELMVVPMPELPEELNPDNLKDDNDGK